MGWMRDRALTQERTCPLKGERPYLREQRAEVQLIRAILGRKLEGPQNEVESPRVLRRFRIPGENLDPTSLNKRAEVALGNQATCVPKQARSENMAELDCLGPFARRTRHVVDAGIHKAGRPRSKARDAAKGPIFQRPALDIEELDFLVPVPRTAAMGIPVELGALENVGLGIRHPLDELFVSAPHKRDVIGASHGDDVRPRRGRGRTPPRSARLSSTPSAPRHRP